MVNFGLNSASVLAQVNFGTNSASILGILLAVSGAALYFLRSVRPELARDHDIFFAAVGLLCGFILIFQGWRLDPILQFGQLLLTGATVFFAVESIRLRGVATEQAKRNTRIVDEDRPVSPRYEYQAELDDLEPLEEEYSPRRIRGTREVSRGRTDEYEDEAPRSYRRDEYDDEAPRRSSNRGSSAERLGQGNKPRRRGTTRPASRPQERPEEDEWSSPQRSDRDWNVSSGRVSKSPRTGSNGSSRLENRNADVSPRPKKRRPSQGSSRQESDVEATPTDYVDYKPIDRSDGEPDNATDFDEP